MNTDLVSYYRNRAKAYDKVYDKPGQQTDLQQSAQILQRTFAGMDVLEIACGTGYWTEKMARTARSITATDINEAVLEIARTKTCAPATVAFHVEDLFYPQNAHQYDGLFGGFIWSHIPQQDLPQFIRTLNRRVKQGGVVALMDNTFVPGSSTPIAETDPAGNTYQIRTLDDKSTYRVLKNFPPDAQIRQLVAAEAETLEIIRLTYYWILIYRV